MMDDRNFVKVFQKAVREHERFNEKWVLKDVPPRIALEALRSSEVRLWSVPRTTGELLKFLVVAMGSKTVLELGTSGGYSTMWLAWGVKITGGHVYTIEILKPKIKIAQRFFQKSHLSPYITQIQGDINQVLANWKKPVDFVFLDANKGEYLAHTKKVLPFLQSGGILIADNAGNLAKHMRDFFDFVRMRRELMSHFLDADNGLLLAIKL